MSRKIPQQNAFYQRGRRRTFRSAQHSKGVITGVKYNIPAPMTEIIATFILKGELYVPEDISRKYGESKIVKRVEGCLRHPNNQLKVQTEAGALNIRIPNTLCRSAEPNDEHDCQCVPYHRDRHQYVQKPSIRTKAIGALWIQIVP